MKRILTATAAVAMALSVAGGALAQGHDHGDDHHGAPAMHGGGHGDWRKGGHIAQNDWSRGAPVDWHAHHLRRPPHGYEWREVDGNYVLAAAATGLIAGLILANQ